MAGESVLFLTVRVAERELQESGRVLRVGEEFTSWLTFEEAERTSQPAEDVQVIEGIARPLPSWPGVTYRRHPVQIDFGGAALYWDAPEPVSGAVNIAGTIRTNVIDAPDGFPKTAGTVRRVRMGWQDYVMGPEGSWRGTDDAPRYEEVSATYFPPFDEPPVTPEAEAAWQRRVREIFDREVAAGRHDPKEPIAIFGGPEIEISEGATETRWMDVLIDLELAAHRA